MAKINRSSVTGRFITAAKAKKSPKTTQTETVKRKPKKKKMKAVKGGNKPKAKEIDMDLWEYDELMR